MNEDETNVARLRDAASLLRDSITRATAGPWTFFDEHGRDYTDEGWSVVGVQGPGEQSVAITHGPGYETEEPDENAALIALLSSAGPHLPEALTVAATLLEGGTQSPLIESMLRIASAILDLFEEVDYEEVKAHDSDNVVRLYAVGGRVRRDPR